jgi:formyltetrahydrofolate-dependent phosphoribosylglycinamide formyltransferase
MIYLDSAATTLQKPPTVARSMARAVGRLSSPGRGGYPAAMRAAETAFRCRELAAELFGVASPENVVFTSNATHGLNIALKSLTKPGARVLVSGYEHNSVIRPLRAAGAELIVLAGFLSILSEDFVKRYPRRIINVHPSLIPSFCGDGFYGLRVHEAALARGVKLTGATVHFVDEITDGGEIIMQKAVRVLPGDTAEILQKRVMKQAEHIILPKAVELTAKEIAKNK